MLIKEPRILCAVQESLTGAFREQRGIHVSAFTKAVPFCFNGCSRTHPWFFSASPIFIDPPYTARCLSRAFTWASSSSFTLTLAVPMGYPGSRWWRKESAHPPQRRFSTNGPMAELLRSSFQSGLSTADFLRNRRSLATLSERQAWHTTWVWT